MCDPLAILAEFVTAQDELEILLLAAEDNRHRCVILDQWELSHHGKPYFHNVRNQANSLRNAYARGEHIVVNINKSKNVVVQTADGLAQIGNENAAKINVATQVVDPLKIQQMPPRAVQWVNIIVSAVAAFLVLWWLAPQEWSLGGARLYVTVGVAVFASVYMLLGYAQFRRKNWEKLSYFALGSVLIFRSLVPSIFGGLAGKLGTNEDGVLADFVWYFGTSNDVALPLAQIAVGGILIGFAYLTKTQ